MNTVGVILSEAKNLNDIGRYESLFSTQRTRVPQVREANLGLFRI
jgi:hypothetical protein